MTPAAKRARGSLVVKVLVAAGILGVLAFLFLQSLRSTRAEPYVAARARLAPWTLAIETAVQPGDAVLVARGSQELVSALFRQVFTRMMESLNAPATAAIPIVLKSELGGPLAQLFTPEALLIAAREAGLEGSGVFEPHCMAHRRVSQPGSTRQVYFAVFTSAPFDRFRRDLATRAARDLPDVRFDPEALSPIMFVAASDGRLSNWLPLRVERARECVAPIEVR